MSSPASRYWCSGQHRIHPGADHDRSPGLRVPHQVLQVAQPGHALRSGGNRRAPGSPVDPSARPVPRPAAAGTRDRPSRPPGRRERAAEVDPALRNAATTVDQNTFRPAVVAVEGDPRDRVLRRGQPRCDGRRLAAPGGPVTTVSGPAAMRSSIRGRRITHSLRAGGVIFESSTLSAALGGLLVRTGGAGIVTIGLPPYRWVSPASPLSRVIVTRYEWGAGADRTTCFC